ncbi:MAG: DUF2461 domain-containing protein [Ilumatobacteraceae bacterium]
MTFSGFPVAAIDFYERLGADNSKTFWHEHKATFDTAVKAPMIELCAELAEFGPFRLFRPQNDLRFAKDRPPYKTQQGAYGETEGGAGYYVQLSAAGLMCGAGYYAMEKDQLERFRDAVDRDHTGPEVAAICAALGPAGSRIGAIDELKTAPRGYPKDHPRIDLLRRKGLMTFKEFGAPGWIHTRKAVTKVRDQWRLAGDLCGWLDANVGPSTLPPPDFLR